MIADVKVILGVFAAVAVVTVLLSNVLRAVL
jgi:hypothetical protein